MDLFRPNDSFTRGCNLRQAQYADALRFSIVTVLGSVIALTSIAHNLLLFYVFSTSRRLRRQNYANPVLLAFFDLLVSVCYIGLSSVQVAGYHFHSTSVVLVWIGYVKYVYCVKHICVAICNFLLVIASLERLFANSPEGTQVGTQKKILVFMVQRKIYLIISVFIMAIILKGSLFFETGIEYLPNCGVLERFVPIQLNHEWPVSKGTSFWIRNLTTILLPFILLFYCNCCIVLQLREKRKETKRQSRKKISLRGGLTTGYSSIRKHYHEKKGVRIATRTLVMVAGCYLLSNSISTIVNFWEFSDPPVLEDNFYAFLVMSDISSLLTIVGCALRLPIYCVSDGRIRKAIGRAILRCRVKAIPMEVLKLNKNSATRYFNTDVIYILKVMWLQTQDKAEAYSKQVQQGKLEKWSLVVVSNSLRSNLTGMNNLFASQDFLNGRSMRARDELAYLLQNRRKILVDMAFRLAIEKKNSKFEEDTAELYLTDIQEEESTALNDRRNSRFQSYMADL